MQYKIKNTTASDIVPQILCLSNELPLSLINESLGLYLGNKFKFDLFSYA